MTDKKSKTKKWKRPRHTFFRMLVNGLLRVYIKANYHFKPTPFKGDRKRQYLVLINHQTPLDQFFATISFRKTFYCVGSEDLFSAGFASRFMEYAIAPIPIRKQTSDFSAVLSCARVAKEGNSIIIFPEGNRTYSGKTEYINPSIARFVRLLKLPVVFYRIEGGYGVYPRWSDKTRKGKMRAGVSKIVEPEEYSKLSDEQLYELIKSELYVCDAVKDGLYYNKKNAEYLERLIYVCPDCGLSTFSSKKDTLTCTKCGKTVKYLPDKTLSVQDGKLDFTFVNDWYEYQKSFINSLNPLEIADKPLYKESARLFKVILFKNKRILDKNSKITLYSNKIEFTEKEKVHSLSFDDVSSITVLGKNKLNIYYKDKVYQFKGDKGFNAIKYTHLFNRYKNFLKGDLNEQFLGL